MKFSQCLSTIFVCLVYSTLTSCAPVNQSYIERLRQEFQSGRSRVYSENVYPINLISGEIWAASVGKTYFKLPESLSEDCVRTAMVIVDFQSKPSTWADPKILAALLTSANSTVRDIVSNVSMTNPVESFCQYVNQAFSSQSDLPKLAELKKAIVELPKPAKNYYYEMQPGKSLEESMGSASASLDTLSRPEGLKTVVLQVSGADKQMHRASPIFANVFANVFDALTQLAQNEKLKATVDAAVLQALDDYVKWELSQVEDSVDLQVLWADLQQSLFVIFLDRRMRANAALSDEYKKIMTELFQADRKNRKSQLKKPLEPNSA